MPRTTTETREAEMRRFRVVFGTLALASAAACGLLQSGPSDKEVTATVEKAPPAPPTLGPTILSEVTSVNVERRGRYSVDGKYWPVRVRVKGAARSKLSPFSMLALADAASKEKPQSVEFVEEARLAKDDFGEWRVSYNYDRAGPSWRFADGNTSAVR
jgi:hypothetical protein